MVLVEKCEGGIHGTIAPLPPVGPACLLGAACMRAIYAVAERMPGPFYEWLQPIRNQRPLKACYPFFAVDFISDAVPRYDV